MTVGNLLGEPGRPWAGGGWEVWAGWQRCLLISSRRFSCALGRQPGQAEFGSCQVSSSQVMCSSDPSWLRPPDVGFTPPSSPPTRPRNDRNVFSRLTSNQSQGSALDK